MKLVFCFAVLLYSLFAAAQPATDILPKPQQQTVGKSKFTLNSHTVIVWKDEADKKTADFLRTYLIRYYNLYLKTGKNQPASNYVLISTKKFIQPPANEEHYTLDIRRQNILISGDSYKGSFRAVQTLIQLLPLTSKPPFILPETSIDDQPAFAYRGMHLDVARHFFDVDFIKQYIDILALHKFNTFHWHLTDDQGWRIAIKKHPLLTAKGSCRNGTIIGRYPGTGNDNQRYCGYYTQEQIKEVVQYAADRYITVIPEIEMPGHASAAIAAYPQLSCFPDESTKIPFGTVWSGDTSGKQVQQTWGVFEDVFCAGKEETFAVLQDVLDEVMELFPSQLIHIGGDECPKANWKRCAFCQQRMKTLGLKDEHELQSYFIQRIEKYINNKGRSIIGWDEILEGGLAPNATVMSWRGEKGGIEAAKQKHPVIMSPEAFVYLDFAQAKKEDSVTRGRYLPVEKVYGYTPVPASLNAGEATYIKGAQANVWSEYIQYPSKVTYQALPRMAALAEVLWSGKKDSADFFSRRLETQFKRYDLWKLNYSKAVHELKATTVIRNNQLYWKVQSPKMPRLFTVHKNIKDSSIVYDLTVKPIQSLINAEKTEQFPDTDSILTPITTSGKYAALAYEIRQPVFFDSGLIASTQQLFSIHKATAKPISVAAPSTAYPGEGGINGLVNGIKATQFNSTEWLGWLAKDVEIKLDLLQADSLTAVKINMWKQEPSYIFLPKSVEVFTSEDSISWQSFKLFPVNGKWPDERTITVGLQPKTKARFIRILLNNYGKVPEGRPGAGSNTWLFADEIEVE